MRTRTHVLILAVLCLAPAGCSETQSARRSSAGLTMTPGLPVVQERTPIRERRKAQIRQEDELVSATNTRVDGAVVR